MPQHLRLRVYAAALVFFLAVMLFMLAVSCSSDGLRRTAASTYVEGGQFDTEDGKPAYVAAGFKPLAALEPPTEVRWADDLPDGVEVQQPPPKRPWWEDFTSVQAIVLLVLGGLGTAGAAWARKQYQARNPNPE